MPIPYLALFFLHLHIHYLTSTSPGGRTAWSTITTINGVHYPARFWYDGEYVAQAKEDSAEIALRSLTGTMDMRTEPPPASAYQTRTQA
jgi:hypothetical protein